MYICFVLFVFLFWLDLYCPSMSCDLLATHFHDGFIVIGTSAWTSLYISFTLLCYYNFWASQKYRSHSISVFLNQFLLSIFWSLVVNLLWVECHMTPLMISQHSGNGSAVEKITGPSTSAYHSNCLSSVSHVAPRPLKQASQCWHRFLSQYCITRLQWVNNALRFRVTICYSSRLFHWRLA